jgi:hypothetical protein
VGVYSVATGNAQLESWFNRATYQPGIQNENPGTSVVVEQTPHSGAYAVYKPRAVSASFLPRPAGGFLQCRPGGRRFARLCRLLSGAAGALFLTLPQAYSQPCLTMPVPDGGIKCTAPGAVCSSTNPPVKRGGCETFVNIFKESKSDCRCNSDLAPPKPQPKGGEG